jgi:hypothetical protein
MSDRWQYRVRVTGPDRERWLAKAREDTFGSKRDLVTWPMTGRFHDGSTFHAGATWYNVRVTSVPEYAEFFGNFSGSPGLYFASAEDQWRHGPALFDALDIAVEVIGHSWSTDVPGGVYSYRDVYERGALVLDSCEKADDSSVAEKYAPKLLVEFPDDRRRTDEPDEPEDEDEAEEEVDPGPEVCAHGVPFEDPLHDNGCKECAEETRAYLSGLVQRPVS